MSWRDRSFWRPYVPVAQRKANAAREAQKLAKKGHIVSPVVLKSKTIANSFWGKAWCENLEAYSDFANRLPRGRTYVRNGSVVDLQISGGTVNALVSGSSLYKIKIDVKPVPPAAWEALKKKCAGKIESLIEMLQGKLSDSVMETVTHPSQGLFPKPAEIKMSCSCPDWAGLCKHLAAVLYGIGARLDEKPELLFLLRGIDPSDLVSQASTKEAVRQATSAHGKPKLSDSDLADVFDIEIEPTAASLAPSSPPASASTKKAASPSSLKTKPKTKRLTQAAKSSPGRVAKPARPQRAPNPKPAPKKGGKPGKTG